jgi:hypothetical protein
MGFQGVRNIWGDEYKCLDEVLESTAQALFKMESPGGLELPSKTRLSEQEPRFLFCYELQHRKVRFALEHPTRYKYRWANSDLLLQGTNRQEVGTRARVDVSIFEHQQTSELPMINVEFKAGLPPEKSIIQDLVKLVREQGKGIWFLTLPLHMNDDKARLASLERNLKGALTKVAHVETENRSNEQVYLFFVDPSKGSYHGKFLNRQIWENPDELFKTGDGAPFYEAW